MPWLSEWVPAEVFFEHKNVQVFNTYRNEEMGDGAYEYFFVLDERGGGDDAFDVRELSTWNEAEQAVMGTDLDVVKEALRLAIEKGELVKQKEE